MVVVRKKRLVTLALTVVLAVAALAVALVNEQGALKYLFTWDPAPAGSAATGSGTGTGSGSSQEPVSGGSGTQPGGGETVPVPEPDFFADFRLDRERARGEQLEYLREMINNTKLDEATRKQAGEQWLAISKQVGKELELEGLIKAKGFEDCIVFVQESSCTVVIKAEKLSRSQVAQVGDIVVRGTGLPPNAVNIVSRPK